VHSGTPIKSALHSTGRFQGSLQLVQAVANALEPAGRHRVDGALMLVHGPCSSVDCARSQQLTRTGIRRFEVIDRAPPLTASTLRRLLRGTWPAPDDQLIETPYLRPVQPRSASNCCTLMASPSCRYASLAEFMMEAFRDPS
jgi:hypothetical protein